MVDFIIEQIFSEEFIAGAVLTILFLVFARIISRLPPEKRPSLEKFTCATAVWLILGVAGLLVFAVAVLYFTGAFEQISP